jgi:glycosyltransferase involved in cell wall biosynthesis
MTMVNENNTVAAERVFDLTEVLLASTGKLRYYGIARVVAEIAIELCKLDPAFRYCVYAPGHDCFFEVHPKVGPDGVVNLNVPLGIRQLRLRQKFYNKNLLRDVLAAPVRALINAVNRRAWAKSGVRLDRINLDGKVFVSCGRPKLIVDAIGTMKRQGMRCQIVPLLHDMIPLHDQFGHRQKSFPTNFIGDNQTIISEAALVLANSEFTRDEIISFSNDGHLPPVPHVAAIPLVHECPEGHEAPEQTVPDAPYILSVGTATGRKNVEVIFEAMRRMQAEGKAVPYFCLAGSYRKRTKEYLEDPKFDAVRDHVVIRENPNQTDLVALYRGALALVISSRMEGWGLPAGEALWLGTPAVCSTAPVLREVCGDLGLYFDPDQPDELVGILDRLLGDPVFLAAHRQRISDAKPGMRTWNTVAQDVLQALNSKLPVKAL